MRRAGLRARYRVISLLSAVRHRLFREDASDQFASSPSSPDGPLAAGAPAAPLSKSAGIELNGLTGTVTRDGRTIELTTKERAVLEALLKASPGALSAERLLEQAWDENVDPFTNTVKVTIARLRRKLGQPDIIHTTPGVGYSITEAS